MLLRIPMQGPRLTCPGAPALHMGHIRRTAWQGIPFPCLPAVPMHSGAPCTTSHPPRPARGAIGLQRWHAWCGHTTARASPAIAAHTCAVRGTATLLARVSLAGYLLSLSGHSLGCPACLIHASLLLLTASASESRLLPIITFV